MPTGRENSIGTIDNKELIKLASHEEKPILFKNNEKRGKS